MCTYICDYFLFLDLMFQVDSKISRQYDDKYLVYAYQVEENKYVNRAADRLIWRSIQYTER